jgi:peptide/nickel transport system ATP-binding protein
VGDQVAEPLAIHEPGLGRASHEVKRSEAFEAVGLDQGLADRFPHQLSGGQRQRVVLARALILRPKLIVMDEPTSALDVSVQAQIMDLISDLKVQFGLTYVFITHDLRNLRRIADRIAVMYAGTIVEEGPAETICCEPSHPYTQALLAAIPSLQRQSVSTSLEGEPPDPSDLPGGCAFHPRCPKAIPTCRIERPPYRRTADGRSVACHLAVEGVVAA